jgi:homospermidine synthase
MLDNPSEGVRVPDDLPWRDVLRVASRYLGTLHSGRADWDPVSSRRDLFARFSDEAAHIDRDDPWQFTNFLVR